MKLKTLAAACMALGASASFAATLACDTTDAVTTTNSRSSTINPSAFVPFLSSKSSNYTIRQTLLFPAYLSLTELRAFNHPCHITVTLDTLARQQQVATLESSLKTIRPNLPFLYFVSAGQPSTYSVAFADRNNSSGLSGDASKPKRR